MPADPSPTEFAGMTKTSSECDPVITNDCDTRGAAPNLEVETLKSLLATEQEKTRVLREALQMAENYLVERGIEHKGIEGRTIVLPTIRKALAQQSGPDGTYNSGNDHEHYRPDPQGRENLDH